jgi:hypothetical protein
MLNLLFVSFLFTQVIKVRQGMNGELNLTVIKTDKGLKVRLIPKEGMIQGFYIINSFEITGKRTRLNTKYGFICGNFLNDKITLCKHQAWKTKFTIESDSAGSIWFKTDKRKCLTKGESDERYGGFKLRLKTCDGANKCFL